MAVTDYNLYFALQDAFRPGGDLSKLDGAGYAAVDGRKAVTFFENHDIDAPQNWQLAAAFVAAYPGYPSLEDSRLQDPAMLNLVWIHTTKTYGEYRNLLKEHDLFVFGRGDSLVAAINQSGDWQSRWVQTRWPSQKLHDYTGHVEQDRWTDASGRVEVSVPPVSYVMLAP
jgi:alpha-amylase